MERVSQPLRRERVADAIDCQRERNLEAEINRLAIAAKSLKLATEQANRLLWTDRERAERILMQALKRAEEDGI